MKPLRKKQTYFLMSVVMKNVMNFGYITSTMKAFGICSILNWFLIQIRNQFFSIQFTIRCKILLERSHYCVGSNLKFQPINKIFIELWKLQYLNIILCYLITLLSWIFYIFIKSIKLFRPWISFQYLELKESPHEWRT